MRYSGTVSFEYVIERYLNLKNGTFATEDQVGLDESDYRYTPIHLIVVGRASFMSGKFSGLPENCFPDESDLELESLRTAAGGCDWRNAITDSERKTIMNLIQEQCMEDALDDYCDPDDKWDEPDSSRDYDYGDF
jgi:hypothetical protein